jgi:urease accessory protein
MVTPAPHHGRLALELCRDGERTVIRRQHSQPPLQIFGLQDSAQSHGAYLQIVNPCGGLFEGDTAEVEVSVGQGVHLHLTTQAATKIYPAEHGGITCQRTRLRVAAGAVLEYFPLPLIPFAHARYVQETTVALASGGVCLLAEVLAPGRLARGERFAYDLVRSRIDGWIGTRPVLFEQMRLEPQRRPIDGWGLLDAGVYLATLYVLTAQLFEAWVSGWNRQLVERYGECIGLTELAHGGLVARTMGQTGQEVWRRLEAVRCLIRREGLGLPSLEVYRPYA